MYLLLKKAFYALIWDENAARRWVHGLTAGVATFGMLVLASPDQAASWTHRQLVFHVLASLAATVAGMLNPLKAQQ